MPAAVKVAALLLAAGRGTRFGGDKLRAPLRGRPLVGHVAATIDTAIRAQTIAGCLTVTAAGDTALRQLVMECGFAGVENPDPAAGVSSSLSLGLKSLALDANVGAALIVLGDQPLLRLEVILALVDRWHETGISARPRYAEHPEQPGHPVLLDRSLWKLVDEARGDTGLKELLPAGAMTIVEVSGSNPDIDTRDDLDSL